MSYKNDLEKIANKVKELIKADIQTKGLVDTGRLYNSVTVNVKLNNDNSFEFEFMTEDYFKYVDARYDIIKDVTASSQFKALEDELLQATMDFYEDELDKIFNKNKYLK
jgi:hypothetical protein